MESKEWQAFLPATQATVKILCIDEMFDLAAIREKVPNAKIYSTIDRLLAEDEACIQIKWRDSGSFELSAELYFFDYILAGDFAGKVEKTKDFFQQIHCYLKENGKIVARFFNARHWKKIEELFRGKTIYAESKRRPDIFWQDLIALIENCGYPELKASCIYDKMPEHFSLQLNSFNFEGEEVDIYSWWIQACCTDEAAEQLRALFTPELRQKMVFLLRRIEHDIEVEKNCQSFWELCDLWGILPGYVVLLVRNALGNPNKALLQVAVFAGSEKQRWQAIILLQEWYEQDAGEDPILSYVLAGLFYLQQDYQAAEQIILAASLKTENLQELLEQVRRKNDRRK